MRAAGPDVPPKADAGQGPGAAGDEGTIVKPPAGKYDSYFERTRPPFVSRLRERKQRVNLQLASAIAAPASVLEIGPGDGLFARACRDAGVKRYVAVEESPAGAARLRDDGFEVHARAVPPLPDGLGSFDLVYASHLVEHLAGPAEVLSLLTSARVALAPGGQIAIAFPDARALGTQFWDCDYTHRWPSTPRRLRQVAADAGLDVVAEHRCCLHTRGVRAWLLRGVTHLLPWRLLELLVPRPGDFWFRGRMLFAPDVLMLLRPGAD